MKTVGELRQKLENVPDARPIMFMFPDVAVVEWTEAEAIVEVTDAGVTVFVGEL